MTYRTSNVARVAGAMSLLVFLAGWGLLSLFVAGETTATTWALGLACMVPVSGLFVAATDNRPLPRPGLQYAVGLVASVLILSVAYLSAVVFDYATIGALTGLNSLTLAALGVGAALLGGGLTLVDRRYVERPVTAALLEERYLDDPIDGD